MDARRIQQINLITSITLILTIGLVTGYTVGYFRATRNHFPEIKIVDEVNPGIATVKLMQMKNGKLYGEVVGRKARLVYSADGILELDEEEKFEIPLNDIHLKYYYQTQDIPENAQFVASQKGKYYYSLFDKRALNISQKNRIYFSNTTEAEKMGYIKK